MSGELELRVSDEDRDRAVLALREHCVEGRLTLEEFSSRLDEAYAARTKGELAQVTRELPARPTVTPRRRGWLLTIFGSEQRRGPWKVPERIFAFSLVGAPDLDFRNAVVGNNEVRITSISLIGALTAKVPPGIDVELGGLALIGGNDLYGDAGPHPEAGVRIRIRSFAVVGGARVHRVQPLG